MTRVTRLALPWVLAFVLPAAAGEEGYNRWAILAPPQPYASGLADLLTARLSGAAGIELVERAELKTISRELVLSNLLGANSAGRLELGRRVKADALVVLGEELVEGKRAVRVVMCDCRLGVRLVSESHLCTREGMDALAAAIARTVAATRERFRSGIQFVVGLSPFISKDLTHDYDYLQSSCAHVLRASLSAVPCVAVIETEEAHAIRRELEATASEGLRRLMPVIVEGEYAVDRQAKPKPTLRIALRVSGAQGIITTIERSGLTFAAATELLSKEAPGAILALSKAKLGQPLPPEAQAAALIARADAFARLGEWQYAAEVREAALLLSPDAADQREAVICEHSKIRKGPSLFTREGEISPDVYAATASGYLARFQLCLEHLEYLIENRKITAAKATSLATSVFGDCMLLGIRGSRYPYAKQAMDLRRQFLVAMCPAVRDLGGQGPAEGAPNWGWLLVTDALSRLVGRDFKKTDLDFVLELLETILPADRPLPPDTLNLFVNDKYYLVDHVGESFTKAEYREFLGKLKASRTPRNAALGRYGELRLTWGEQRQAGGASPQLLAEAQSLRDACSRLPAGYTTKRLVELADDLCGEIQRTLAPAAKTAVGPSRPLPSGRPQPIPGMGPLKFEQIHLRVIRGTDRPKFLTGSQWQSINEVLPCTPTLDVFWAGSSILYMTEPGILREVFTDADRYASCVAWDGRSLWVGTKKKGIWVLNAKGDITARIGPDEGLPPADSAIVLHAIEPGKVCAVGSFYPHRRAWFAVVEQAGGKGRVEVFHEAKRVPQPGEDIKERVENPTIVFDPKWIRDYQPRDRSQGRMLLVGRAWGGAQFESRPLLVNLDKREVLVWENRASEPIDYSKAGETLEARGYDITLQAAPGATFADGKTYRRIDHRGSNDGALSHAIVPYGGFLYVPGSVWHRIDPETMESERLNDPLPRPYSSLSGFAVTAHHGMIGWSSSDWNLPAGTIFRITVAGK